MADAEHLKLDDGTVIDIADAVARQKIGSAELQTTAKDCSGAINELKQSLDGITARNTFNCTATNKTGTSDCAIEGQRNYVINGIAYIAMVLKSGSNTSDIEINLPSNITFRENGFITICGKGARWSVTNVQYLYVGSQEMAVNNITSNTYYHIMLTTPVAVS